MSFIPRLFLPVLSPQLKDVELDESASRYLVKVLRLAEGARFNGFDSGGRRYELSLKSISGPRAQALILSCTEAKAAGVRITLAQSLPKASKMDLILRQATEVGVQGFIPFISQRSISRPEAGQFEHKNDRWKKILVEACRQCGRNDVPELSEVMDWKGLLGIFKDHDQVLLPFEKEAPTLRTVLESKPDAKNILVLIGPEGGWTPEEIQEAGEKGAAAVHLPTPILRTETAGLVTASMIQFFHAFRGSDEP